MNSAGSKNKGSAFERQVCRKLSLLVSEGKRTDCFWRSAMSGGRARLQFNKDLFINQTQSGDISSISELGFWLINTYTIEVKHYKDLQLASGFLNESGFLYTFWKNLRDDCRATGKLPLMIAKQNNRPTIMLTLPRRSPTKLPPVITLHEWPAELRLFDSLEQVINVSDSDSGHTLERQPTRRATLGPTGLAR
jgi:hypothetical protein